MLYTDAGCRTQKIFLIQKFDFLRLIIFFILQGEMRSSNINCGTEEENVVIVDMVIMVFP